MRTLNLWIPVMLVLTGCAILPGPGKKLSLEQQPVSIVISKDAPQVVNFAAKELQTYLKKIGDKEFPIVTDDKTVTGTLILIGKSKYTDRLGIKNDFSPDSFMIKTIGNNLVLLGDDKDKGTPRAKYIPFEYYTSRKGSLYAVYTLLENYFGVRWFWPGEIGEVVPKQTHLSIPADIDIIDKPDFLWRHFFFYASESCPPEVKYHEIPLWYIRNKMGISIGSPYSFAHSWGNYLTNKYFDKHPEYYSLIDGKRMPFRVNKKGRPHGRQVCTSNPEVVKIFVDKIRKRYKPTDDMIVSISPNDGLDFCECEKCKSLDHPELYGPTEGYKGLVLSDRIYSFVNEVAREVKKTHPKLRLGIFSYTVVRPVPRALEKLDDNVVISMTQTNAFYRNKEYKEKNRKRLAEWISKGGAYIGRDYVDNYSFASIMHPQTKILAEDLAFMKKNNYIGFYTEAGMSYATNYLNYYVLAKLMWNPSADLEDILDDFYQKAYGDAAEKMKEYFTLMETSFMNCTTVGIHPGHIPDWYSPETIRKAYQLIGEAEKAARTEKEKKRIRYNLIGLEYTDKVVSLFRIYRRLNDSGLPVGIAGYTPDFSKKYSKEEIVELLKNARKTWQEIDDMLKKYKKTSLIQPYSFYRQNQVKRWSKTIEDYWRLYGAPGNNQRVTTLPDVWKFKTDPQNIGTKEGWFKSDFNDRSWKEIRIDKHWEKQGYQYDGYAWYRLDNINIPAEKIDGTYILRLGAVDESCWLYVNGKPAGQALYNPGKDPDGWKKPRNFNITGFLKPGTNCIAIRVLDSKYAGGIWQRAFLIKKKLKLSRDIIFSESFEGKAVPETFSQHKENASVDIDKTVAVNGNHSLRIQVLKSLPANCSITIPQIEIDGDCQYMISLSYKSVDVSENKDKRQAWLKHPKLPLARIILMDKSRKTCIPVKEYIWFGGKYKEKTGGWETLRRTFKTPSQARFMRLTLFFNAQGNYWIDNITIEKM